MRVGLLAVAAAAALWALGAVIASDLFAAGVDPLELIEVRTWITAGGLALLALRLRAKRPSQRLPLRFTIAFGIAVAVANAAFFLAIERLPVAVAIVLQNLAPGMVAVCALVATRRAPSARAAAALLVALVGVALVAGFPGATLGAGIDLVGVGFGLLTAAGVAAFSILGERSAKAYGAIGSMARAFFIASIAWLAYQLPQGTPELLTATEHLPAVLVVSLLGTLLPFVLFSWGVARVKAQAAVVGVSLEPVFGAAMAWTLLGQPLTVLQLLGGAIVVAGVVYVQRNPTTGTAPERQTNAALTHEPPGPAATFTRRRSAHARRPKLES